MGRYISIFDTNAELQAFSATTEFQKPHVSFTREDLVVHYMSNDYNGYKFVDLDLPSGTVWAKMNVGASSETDYGLYFQWGDTVGYTQGQLGSGKGKKYFGWADYKYNNSGTNSASASNMTKYNASDGLTTLLGNDDAAVENMGGSWRMPTYEDYQELLANTTNEWVTNYNSKGVNGWRFTSKTNGTSLFFPASGYFLNGGVSSVGSGGDYWCSSLLSSSVLSGRSLNFYSGYCGMYYSSRYFGFGVRGVVPK